MNLEWSIISVMACRCVSYHWPRKLLATIRRSWGPEIISRPIQVCINISRNFPSLFHLMSRWYFKHLYSFFSWLLTFWNVRFVIIYKRLHFLRNLRFLDCNSDGFNNVLNLGIIVSCFEITGLSHLIFKVWRWFCLEFLNLRIYNIKSFCLICTFWQSLLHIFFKSSRRKSHVWFKNIFLK